MSSFILGAPAGSEVTKRPRPGVWGSRDEL